MMIINHQGHKVEPRSNAHMTHNCCVLQLFGIFYAGEIGAHDAGTAPESLPCNHPVLYCLGQIKAATSSPLEKIWTCTQEDRKKTSMLDGGHEDHNIKDLHSMLA